MADDDERRVLEDQLELQLQEQRESIAALDEALASDPQNPEILEVHAELLQAIKDAEDGLFVLKRASYCKKSTSLYRWQKMEVTGRIKILLIQKMLKWNR